MLSLDDDIVLTVTQTKSSIQNQLFESVRLGIKPKGHFAWYMATTRSQFIFSGRESALKPNAKKKKNMFYFVDFFVFKSCFLHAILFDFICSG